jgi:hypothetical protein
LSRFIVPPSSVIKSANSFKINFLQSAKYLSQNFFHDDCCKNQRMSNASSENIYLQQFCIWNLNLFPQEELSYEESDSHCHYCDIEIKWSFDFYNLTVIQNGKQ